MASSTSILASRILPSLLLTLRSRRALGFMARPSTLSSVAVHGPLRCCSLPPIFRPPAKLGPSPSTPWLCFFNYPHFMATVYRAYHSYDEISRYRVFTLHVTFLLLCAGLIAHLWYPLLPWLFTLYICWSPWHYTGQNYGLLMMFARRAGLTPRRRAPGPASVVHRLLPDVALQLSHGPSSDP